MKGSAFASTLPEKPTRDREDMIVSAVHLMQHYPLRWAAISSQRLLEGKERSLILYVSVDALMIGDEEDRFRINVTHTGAQMIADTLGLTLPTSKIADLIHEQAGKVISPAIQTPNKEMAYTSRMLQHSCTVGLKKGGFSGLASPVGKHWILSNKMFEGKDVGVNYGWHDLRAPKTTWNTSPGGIRLWQNVGTKHDRWHVDYSQVLVLVHRSALLNGDNVDVHDIMVDPVLHPLVSYEGPLRGTRHPDVPPPEHGVVPALPLSVKS